MDSYRRAGQWLALTALALGVVVSCGDGETAVPNSTPSSAQADLTTDDFEVVQTGTWRDVRWSLYRASTTDGESCLEWTGSTDVADPPVTYPETLDLERLSCLEDDFLAGGTGTRLQPMFTYRLPDDGVGVWGLAGNDVERITVDLQTGTRQEIEPVDGTFAFELDEGATAGEVTLLMDDGTTRECVEPDGLEELAWTCR